MKETDLNVFYQLGAQLTYLARSLSIGMEGGELFMLTTFPAMWLERFLSETALHLTALEDSRASAERFLRTLRNLRRDLPGEWTRSVTQAEVQALSSHKDELEANFEREYRNLDVFTVTPKGIYNTRLLRENPETQFPDRLIPVLPEQMLYDLKQAGRCLAFEVPTACAFHICRGTEALMIAYYERLAKQKWPLTNRDWGVYITHLAKHGAPPSITNRLNEIKDLNRNAYIHPDINVPQDEAQILFQLCAGVNFYMAEEMVRLGP
jgi:hypothetical protein